MRSRRRKILSLAAVALLLSLFAATGPVTGRGGELYAITDDINRQLGVAYVMVGNSDGQIRSGYVEVRAWFKGVPSRRVEWVTVSGKGTATAEVYFGPGLGEIIETAIIEDPDPIPR